jgi:hypothetical protein
MFHVLAACAFLFCSALAAAEPDVKPLLTNPGKVLFSDDLGELPVNPQSRMGKWEVKHGILVGSERPLDKHGAVLRRPKWTFHHAAIEVSFRLDGANGLDLGLINANGRIASVRVTGTSMQLSRSLTGGDRSEVLDTVPLKLQVGAWHTLLLETQGNEIVASIDGEQAVFGAHERIDVDKTCVRLTVSGESVAFKNLRVREAMPSDTWEATKAKLLDARKAAK